MAPTTRSSSAQSSPTVSRLSSAVHTPSTTPSTTPRKLPHCKICNRRMQGHPKSHCPYADSGENEKEEPQSDEEARPLTTAMQSMKLASPARMKERDEENKTFIRNRRRQSEQPGLVPSDTLLSLSTSSSEIMAGLLQPGMFDNTPGDDLKIRRWQDALATTPDKKTPGRQTMPGTLIPPTPEASFASSNNQISKEESPVVNFDAAASAEASFSVTSLGVQPLGRSMSAEERDMFVANLTNEARATIYIVPKADAETIQKQAVALKFITRLVMNDDENDPQALLILGRDDFSVDALLQTVEEENKKAARTKKKGRTSTGTSTVTVAAGSAIVGAVSAWAGLAFS